MIVTDLDGTLLTTNKSITNYTLNVLQKFQAQGIILVIATARSENMAIPYIKILKPDFIIYNNGSLAKDEKYIICEKLIPGNICYDFLQNCINNYKLKNIKVITQFGDFINSVENIKDLFDFKYSDYNTFKYDAYKITIKTSDYIAHQLAMQYTSCSMFKFENNNSFMFTDANATKEIAVRKIAEWCNISMDDIVAFGNDLPDKEMLRICGTGVAVENACQKVKDVANDISFSNDENGVAKWLAKNSCFN